MWDRIRSYKEAFNDGTAIAVVWQVGDILATADEMEVTLTEEQACSILDSIKRQHDADIGINWEVIRTHISMTE